MKPIFNSLGSNYDFRFTLIALGQLFHSKNESLSELRTKLQKMFGGEVKLLYKGRDALQYTLESFGISKGDKVFTQALTCAAIEEAIIRTEAEPIFVDIEQGGLNLSVPNLESVFTHHKEGKALLVQNTLGVPADMEGISTWCKKNKILLIEDLAQSIGGKDRGGKSLGSFGDVVMLSFGRDKIVDAVAGGAIIFKSKPKRQPQIEGKVSRTIIFKDMLYPILTWKVRKTHKILLGRLILRIGRLSGLLKSAIGSVTSTALPMPAPYARLALHQLNRLNEELEHRRQIAHVYYKEINKKPTFLTNETAIKYGTNLRFPFWSSDPEGLIVFLKGKGVYVWDRWYRKPVDSGTLDLDTSYKQGSCKNAEILAESIINLPTHRNVSRKDAKRIAKLINQYKDE